MNYKILIDDCPNNPRDFENLGTIALVQNRYLSGDCTILHEDIETILSNNREYISLPVFAYIHGNIALNTVGFNCLWDSGQIGCIFVKRADVRDQFRAKRISHRLYDKVLSYLSDEIKIYNNYINNEVYGYVITDHNDNELESCWGYYEREHAESDAKGVLNRLSQKAA